MNDTPVDGNIVKMNVLLVQFTTIFYSTASSSSKMISLFGFPFDISMGFQFNGKSYELDRIEWKANAVNPWESECKQENHRNRFVQTTRENQ